VGDQSRAKNRFAWSFDGQPSPPVIADERAPPSMNVVFVIPGKKDEPPGDARSHTGLLAAGTATTTTTTPTTDTVRHRRGHQLEMPVLSALLQSQNIGQVTAAPPQLFMRPAYAGRAAPKS
jgi:hypothetical protein